MEAKIVSQAPGDDLAIGGLYILIADASLTDQLAPRISEMPPADQQRNLAPTARDLGCVLEWEWELYLHLEPGAGIAYYYRTPPPPPPAKKQTTPRRHRMLGFDLVADIRAEERALAMVQVNQFPQAMFRDGNGDTAYRLVEILYNLCRLSREILACRQGRRGRRRRGQRQPRFLLSSRALILRVLRKVREAASPGRDGDGDGSHDDALLSKYQRTRRRRRRRQRRAEAAVAATKLCRAVDSWARQEEIVGKYGIQSSLDECCLCPIAFWRQQDDWPWIEDVLTIE